MPKYDYATEAALIAAEEELKKQMAFTKPIYDSPNNRLRAQNSELIAVLEKIANLPPRSTAGSSIARSALDTMRLLNDSSR
jgi:hypothetical protein